LNFNSQVFKQVSSPFQPYVLPTISKLFVDQLKSTNFFNQDWNEELHIV